MTSWLPKMYQMHSGFEKAQSYERHDLLIVAELRLDRGGHLTPPPDFCKLLAIIHVIE
jgi:hypothetical protein